MIYDLLCIYKPEWHDSFYHQLIIDPCLTDANVSYWSEGACMFYL